MHLTSLCPSIGSISTAVSWRWHVSHDRPTVCLASHMPTLVLAQRVCRTSASHVGGRFGNLLAELINQLNFMEVHVLLFMMVQPSYYNGMKPRCSKSFGRILCE